MAKFWKKLCSAVQNIERFIMIWLILIFGLLMMVDVVLRKAGYSSVPWVAELSRYMLVTTTMIGSALLVKSNGHINMDLLMNVLSKKAQTCLRLFNALFGMAFWFFFGIYSAKWTLQLMHLNKSIECMSIPFWPFWVPFVISCFLAGIRYVERFVQEIMQLVRKDGQDDQLSEEAARQKAEG